MLDKLEKQTVLEIGDEPKYDITITDCGEIIKNLDDEEESKSETNSVTSSIYTV